MEDSKFNYFKKLIMNHIDKLEKKEAAEKKDVAKSILAAETIQKAGYPIGTIRVWKGKKYIKVAPNKWRPKYDSDSRGAKLSIAALKRKADNCTNSEELLQLVLENKERFSDQNGRPLPFVKELSDYISARNDKIESSKDVKTALENGYKKDKNGIYYNQEKGIGFRPDGNGRYDVYINGKYHNMNVSGLNGIENMEKQALTAKEFADKAAAKDLENKKKALKEVEDAIDNAGDYDDIEELENERQKLLKEIRVNATPEEKAQVTKTTAFNKEIESIINKQIKHDSVDEAIKALEKHKEWVHSIIPHDETLHEKATREGREEAIQSVIDQLKKGDKDITEKFVKEPAAKNELAEIRNKYESSKSVTGNKKTVTLPDGSKIKCHYKIVEADAPTASHDEKTFQPSNGFPTTAEGKTINDRDYQNDTDAQESVRKIANNFNSLALESPPIVTKDGIVISGNNRTMSSKLAAKNGTDKAYLQDLKEMADEYGIDPDSLAGFENPRLILETDNEHEGDYTTEEFAKFNRNTKKTMNNVERAVKITKTLNSEKIKSIAESLTEYDTMGELYADTKGCQNFVNKLIQAGVIGENEKAQYLRTDGTLNDTGKDFAETVLVGSVLKEDNIRRLDGAGGKRIRQKLVRAILPLIENKGNGKEYSFNQELNEAVEIAVNVAKNHETFPDVKTYIAQGNLFGEKQPDKAVGRLAEIIHDEGEKAFAQRMKDLGAGLRQSAAGEQDIFLGGVESKESLFERFLDMKKSITNILTKLVNKERTTTDIVEGVLKNMR